MAAFQEDSTAAPAADATKAETPENDAAAATDFDPPAAATAAAGPDAVTAPPSEEAKNFQPLDEVRDEIRRTIAETKVTEQLSTLMGSLESKLNESYTEYFGAASTRRMPAKSRHRLPRLSPT